MLVLVKIEISGQTNSVSPENENFQYLRREEQEKIRGDRNCCSIGFKTGRIAYPKMKRALSIFTAGLMVAPVAIAQESAEGLEVAELSRKEDVDFATEILPIFRKNCLACHNAKDADADLNLESPSAIAKGGESGPMVIPGNADKSQLMAHIRQTEKPFMPPRRNKVGADKLTPYQLGLVKLWINQGAKGEVRQVTQKLNWRPVPITMTPIYTTAISPDGQFAACGRGNQIFVYHLPTQRLSARLSDPGLAKGVAHRDLVQSLSFSPDGRTLASGGFRVVKLWSNKAAEPAKVVNLMPGGEQVVVLDVALGQARAIVAGDRGAVRAIDLNSMMPVWRDQIQGQAAEQLQLSPDGKRVAALFSDGRVRTWDAANGDRLTREASPLGATSIAWLDAERIVTGHAADGVKIWAANNPGRVTASWGSTAAVSALAVLGEGATVLVGQTDGKVLALNPADGKTIKTIDHGAAITGLRVKPDSTQLVTLGGPVAQLWDTAKWTSIAQLKGDPRAEEQVAIAQQELEFAKAEVGYHKANVEAKQKQLKQDQDAHKKAKDALAGHEKTAADKAKEKTDSEAALKKLNDEIAALPKRVEAATKGKTEAETTLKSGEAALAKAKTDLANAEKTLAETAATKAALTEQLMQLGAAANSAKLLAADAQKAAAKAKGDQDLATQSTGAGALAKRKAREFEAALNQFGPAVEKLAKAEAAKVSISTALAKHEEGVKTAKVELEKQTKELAAAQDRQKKSGEEKKNLEKKITDATTAITNAEREIELSKAEVGFTATNVKNAEAAVKAATDAQTEAGKVPAAREAGVADAKAQAGAGTQDWIDAVYSEDGVLVYTLGVDGRIQSWSTTTGQRAHEFSADGRLAKRLALLSGGRLALAGGSPEAAIISASAAWSLANTIGTGDENSPFEDRVIALDFSPDGEWLATGGGFPSRGGEIYIWNVEDGSEELRIPEAHSDTVCSLAFSPDGSQLASGGTDRFARIFEMNRGKELRALEGHTGHVLGVSWQRNGRVLASVGADKAVKVWNLINGEQKKSFSGFNKEVTSVHFLGIGTQAVVSAGDNVVKVVKEDGGEVRRLPETPTFMHSSDVTPDGKFAVAGGFDGVLRIWDVNAGKLLHSFAPEKESTKVAAKK